MERTPAQRKQHRQHLRRKYKRYAAAVAGAAIMTGALLPGIPAAKVLAAESPSNLAPVKTVQTAQLDKNTRAPVKKVIAERVRHEKRHGHSELGWHEHEHSWPSPDDNQIKYENGRVYYRSDPDRYRTDNAHYLSSPVDFVKDRAAMYGLDPNLDSFTLLSLTSHKAIVQVTQHDNGSLFNVFLERDHDTNWKITDFRAR